MATPFRKRKEDFQINWVPILTIVALAFIFSFQASNDLLIKGNKLADSSVFQYVARVIKAGGMPYRDTFDHKGPLLYLINFLGIKIAEWRGIWVLELAAIFFTFFFIYRIAQIYTDQKASLAVLLIATSLLFSFFDGGNLTEEYAMPFIAASLYIFIDYFVTSYVNTFRLILCGFSFSAILMLRPNMCGTWLVLCVGVAITCIRSKDIKSLGRFITWFLFGMLLLLVPILLWLSVNDALKACWDDYILFNLNYSSNEVRASLTNRINALTFFLDRGVIWVSLICLCVLPQKTFFDILYLVYLGISLLLLCISGRSYGHYGMILIPALAYPLARTADWLKERLHGVNGNAISTIFILYLVVTFAASPWLNGIQNVVLEYDKRGVYFGQRELETVSLVQSHSTENDQIIVLGNWNIIYNLSNRFAASRFSYQMPPLTIDEDRAKVFYQEIEENEPQIIVMPQNAWFAHDWMLQYIEENGYYVVGTTTDGAITVYSRND
ncbi:MAG TPA: hypothetical protein DCR07_05830 [Lactococcus sp.]|nr:hypothetical protein [Lactococcus sp.]